jgi:nucleotide-binding universal stress UspA family protein
MKPKILVPFDFSAGAEAALAWAADLQRTSAAGPIQMVHAVSTHPPGVAELAFELIAPSSEEIAELENRMKEFARQHGANAEAIVLAGPIAVGDIILDASRSRGADVIVMGTHGRTGVRRLLLGSIAEHVLRRADCPVVSVHARALPS